MAFYAVAFTATLADRHDTLDGHDEPYLLMEKHVFGGIRDRALRSIKLMYIEGLLAVAADCRRIESWQLDQWRREPDETSTLEVLQRVVLSLGR